MIRSPLRYPGGKFKAMTQIMPLIPENVKDWREPFFGGGSVTLYYLQQCLAGKLPYPETITVGDLNTEIHGFWVGCRDCSIESAYEALAMYSRFNRHYTAAYSSTLDTWRTFEGTAPIRSAETEDILNRYDATVEDLYNKCEENYREAFINVSTLANEYGMSVTETDLDDYYAILAKTRGEEEKVIAEAREFGPRMGVDYSPLSDEEMKEQPLTKFLLALWGKIYGEAREMFAWLKENYGIEGYKEKCARQFLVNRISFSGMGDAGTLSKDQYMDFRMTSVSRLVLVSTVLQKTKILNVSFEEIMRLEPQGTATEDEVFIFLDPPYLTQEASALYGKDGEMHAGFPHQMFVDECKKTKYKFLVTYDDSTQVRRMFRGLHMMPFKLQYTMAGKTSDDALAGEELFIANYNIEGTPEEDEVYDI